MGVICRSDLRQSDPIPNSQFLQPSTLHLPTLQCRVTTLDACQNKGYFEVVISASPHHQKFFMKESFLAGFLVVCTLFLSCRKEAASGLNASPFERQLISKTKMWLNDKEAAATEQQKPAVKSVIENLDLPKFRTEELNNGEQLIVIPLLNGFTSRYNKGASHTLLLILNREGNIRKGNIVQYKENGMYAEIPENAFFKIYNNKLFEKDGDFAFLDIYGRYVYGFTYKDGKLHAMKRVEKGFTPATESGRANSCTDWYMVTYIDGVEVESTYLFTTCTGGGGGGGIGENEVPEDPGGGTIGATTPVVSKQVMWTVAVNPYGYWEVISIERLSGQRSENDPRKGSFTKIEHLTSSLKYGAPAVTWNELAATVSLRLSNAAAMSTVSGRINEAATGAFILITGTNAWDYYNEFP